MPLRGQPFNYSMETWSGFEQASECSEVTSSVYKTSEAVGFCVAAILQILPMAGPQSEA